MLRRSFHSGSIKLLRKRIVIKDGPELRPPIPPTVKNVTVSNDHPLWQFFHDKKYMREFTDLDQTGRPWSIPELRKKSFSDLHSLWYSCLKERNILAREHHLLISDLNDPDSSRFLDQSDQVRETMWRIRHVLSERHHAYERSKEKLPEHREELIKEFKDRYLNATPEEETEIQESLSRFQFALYGINEVINKNVVDVNFVQGLKFIANLKLERYGSANKFYEELKPITDVGEAFVLFHSEPNTESTNEAIKSILELREKEIKVSKYDEIETVKNFIKRLVEE